jgi:regulator of nonsense transcripts 2
MEEKLVLLKANSAKGAVDETQLKSRDSSLKKITPFLKKVGERLGEATRGPLCAEIEKLNLSKYVEEVAVGVAEAKLKLSDVPAAVQVRPVIPFSCALTV